MVVWLPIDSSFVVFAHAFLDDAWGFALGWLYTVTNALSAAGEVAAVAAIFNFWTVSVNNGTSSNAAAPLRSLTLNSTLRGDCVNFFGRPQHFRGADLRRRRILLLAL